MAGPGVISWISRVPSRALAPLSNRLARDKLKLSLFSNAVTICCSESIRGPLSYLIGAEREADPRDLFNIQKRISKPAHIIILCSINYIVGSLVCGTAEP